MRLPKMGFDYLVVNLTAFTNHSGDHILYTEDPIQLSDTWLQLSNTPLSFVWGPIPNLLLTMFWYYA